MHVELLVRALPDPGSDIRINTLHVPALLSPPRSYSRDQPVFLQLKDYFWVKARSAYELPYGTKGSGEYCLVLWRQWAPLGHPLLGLCPRGPSAQALSQAERGAVGAGRGQPLEGCPCISPFRSVLSVEDLLLRVLAITSYSVPESIQR